MQCRDVISKGTRSSGSTHAGSLAAVDITKAKKLLLENVPGLTDPIKVGRGDPPPTHRSNHDAVKCALNVRGYAFASKAFDSRSSHIPHSRNRLYMAGTHTGFTDMVDVLQAEGGFSTRINHFFAGCLGAMDVPTSLRDFLFPHEDSAPLTRNSIAE